MSESELSESELSEPVVGLPVADTSRPIAVYNVDSDRGLAEYRIGPYQVLTQNGLVVAWFRNPLW